MNKKLYYKLKNKLKMKTLFKLFLAVVALFAYSCVTDTTEDLGVQVGGGQTTEITISLEESRTQLGEKATHSSGARVMQSR